MLYFFGIDVTQNKQNETWNAQTFLDKEIPAQQARIQEECQAQILNGQTRAQLPKPFQVIRYIATFFSIAIVVGILRGLGNVGIEKAYENAPALFYMAGLSLVLWAILSLWSCLRQHKAEKTLQLHEYARRLEMITESCYESLGVPRNAPEVDVMVNQYKLQGDKPKLVSFPMSQYRNPMMRIFLEDNRLYLADSKCRYSIPLHEIRSLKKVKKSASLSFWNKDQGFREEPYKAYKITANNYGSIFVKAYYTLVIYHNGQEYHLLFPSYELPAFQSLLHMQVTE